MVTSKPSRFPVKLELPSGADQFCPTFFVILCTFANELSNVRARKGVKVPDVSRHSARCEKCLATHISIFFLDSNSPC